MRPIGRSHGCQRRAGAVRLRSATGREPGRYRREPSVEASPDGSATGGTLCAVEYETCPIPAGSYTVDTFRQPFTFTIGDAWQNDRDWPDSGGISTDIGGIYWSTDVMSGVVDDNPSNFESTIDGFIGHLESYEGFDVTAGEATTIGGEPATVVDVLTNETLARGLYLTERDEYSLAPGEAARFYLMERDGSLVTFVIESWIHEDFEAFHADAQPVLDSIAWE